MTNKTASVHLYYTDGDNTFTGDDAMTVISQLKAKKEINLITNGQKSIVPYHSVTAATIQYKYEEVTNPTDAVCGEGGVPCPDNLSFTDQNGSIITDPIELSSDDFLTIICVSDLGTDNQQLHAGTIELNGPDTFEAYFDQGIPVDPNDPSVPGFVVLYNGNGDETATITIRPEGYDCAQTFTVHGNSV